MTEGPAEQFGERPLVRRIQDVLRDRIRGGELSPGQKLASMRRLADDFDCSLGIVKQAVNTLVAQGFLRSSPRRGVYVADTSPAAREILIVLPHLEVERLHLALTGVRRALRHTGYRISIHAQADPEDKEVPAYLTSSQIAGVLIMLPSRGDRESVLTAASGAALPTVVVDIAARIKGVDTVLIDPIETSRLGIQHLFAIGHKKMGLVVPIEDERTISGIENDVLDSVRRQGMPADRIIAVHVERAREDYEQAWSRARDNTERLIREHGDVTAVIGIGPQMTLGAALGAQAAGRVIPDTCSVLGLLGDSSALQSFRPPITIFDNPLVDTCEHATIRLLGRIDGYDAAPGQIKLSAKFIERESIGPV
ncbi:MAG: GntR family transcriptional regulator, partial [Phycisphaerales bacterium]|nr:GntR family transcriptional regulator [Phycisphaerales bacterium]